MNHLATVLVIVLLSLSTKVSGETPAPHITINVPMRDGVTLPTDIYLPNAEARHLPCILVRAPNGRESHASKAAPFALEGYAVAIQDTRSRLDPEGKTLPYLSDGWGAQQDGYDTVQWLANSCYSNGKVGTFGVSAQGITQLLMAPASPPNLTCQHIGVAAANLYDHGIFHGGQLRKSQVESWLGYYARHPSVLNYVSTQPIYNDFWRAFDSVQMAPFVTVPAIHHGGWYDVFCQGTIDAFVSRQNLGGQGARGTQKLVIGPWTHFWPEDKRLGDFMVPEAAAKGPMDYSPLRWFDHYLKGIDNDVEKSPAVTYYVMGPFDGTPSKGNVWHTTDSWPPPATSQAFYFTNTGGLIMTPPEELAKVSYLYDPADPVPTLGGRNLFLQSGPVDQRPNESRDDVVIFTSEPLQEDLEVTGRLFAHILFSTDQEDTDVVVRLSDVYPDGRSMLVTDGIRRLAATLPTEARVGSTRGPREMEVDLWSTSMVFAKGHRIRVSISSSNYPRYDRNPNKVVTGSTRTAFPIAHNTVYLGGIRGSRLVLPVIGER